MPYPQYEIIDTVETPGEPDVKAFIAVDDLDQEIEFEDIDDSP